jgi:hypothetical protein
MPQRNTLLKMLVNQKRKSADRKKEADCCGIRFAKKEIRTVLPSENKKNYTVTI